VVAGRGGIGRQRLQQITLSPLMRCSLIVVVVAAGVSVSVAAACVLTSPA
jgi:hypothetical protein